MTALLDYIYDGHPEVPVEVALELLQLADAWGLPKLLGAIEAGILASLDSSVALQVLQEAHGLDSLRIVCEDKVAEEFEACSQHPEFGKLSASQLAQLLKREDLAVSCEEASGEGNLYLDQGLRGQTSRSGHAAATRANSIPFG